MAQTWPWKWPQLLLGQPISLKRFARAQRTNAPFSYQGILELDTSKTILHMDLFVTCNTYLSLQDPNLKQYKGIT